MKVLKPPKEFKPIHTGCPNCDAELVADDIKDFKRVKIGGDFREPGDDYAVATCPCCGQGIRFDRDQFPHHIYEALPVRS